MVFNNSHSSRSGIWYFFMAEMILFGLLFIVYLVYRITDARAFHFAAGELSVFTGAANTIILLISSVLLAKSVSAIRQERKRPALQLLGVTILLGVIFLVTRYFELRLHVKAQIFPGSSTLALRGPGDILFYGFYFFITGLHALHVIVGLVALGYLGRGIARGKIGAVDYAAHEKSGLYWHMVVLLWIFIFLLFYLIS